MKVSKDGEVLKMLEVTEETKDIIKKSAKRANMKLRDYVRLIALVSRSDVGVKQVASENVHDDLMELFGLSKVSTEADLNGTVYLPIYKYVMALKA